MKKSIPKVRERESEASILGNDREREFPLTPDLPRKSSRRDKLLILDQKMFGTETFSSRITSHIA